MLGRAPRSSPIAACCGWPSISEMLSLDRRNGSGLCRCGWPSISEMLSPWLDQIVFAHRCGWPSISEMLSPVDGAAAAVDGCGWPSIRSEEHTSELQSLMRVQYADLCLKKKKNTT